MVCMSGVVCHIQKLDCPAVQVVRYARTDCRQEAGHMPSCVPFSQHDPIVLTQELVAEMTYRCKTVRIDRTLNIAIQTGGGGGGATELKGNTVFLV